MEFKLILDTPARYHAAGLVFAHETVPQNPTQRVGKSGVITESVDGVDFSLIRNEESYTVIVDDPEDFFKSED